MKRLGKESLNLSRTADKQFILVGKFVHAHNGNDVHKFVITLKHALNFTGDFVMLLADYIGRQNTACRFKRVNRGIDTLRCNIS